MAASGALSGFLQAMLELRSQRLREEQAKQAASQAGWEALAGGISSAAGSIGGAIGGMGQAGTYNTAMNQALPPRATAVGPNASALNAQAAQAPLAGQIPYSQVPATMSPHTGGAREFGLRQAMGQFKQDQGPSLANQLSAAKFQRQLQIDQENRANNAVNAMSKQSKEIFADSKGYLEGSSALMGKIQNAGTRDEYMRYANELAALNSVHEGRKLNTPLRQVPPFRDPADTAMADLEAAQAGMVGKPATSPTSMWGLRGGGPTPEATALQEAMGKAQGKYEPMEQYRTLTQPGATPSAAPSSQGAPTGAGGTTSGIPVPSYLAARPDGATAVGPDGRMYRKQGTMLVPIR